MKCPVCKGGELEPGTATVTLERDGTVVVIRDVPAYVCAVCGDYELDIEVASYVQEQSRQAAKRGVEVEIMRYAA